MINIATYGLFSNNTSLSVGIATNGMFMGDNISIDKTITEFKAICPPDIDVMDENIPYIIVNNINPPIMRAK